MGGLLQFRQCPKEKMFFSGVASLRWIRDRGRGRKGHKRAQEGRGIMERRDKRGQEGTRGKVEGVEVTVCTAHPRHQHTGAAQSQNPASIILIII